MTWRDNLSALPDFDDACEVRKTLSNGMTVIERTIPAFVSFDMKGDYPMFFSDEQGAWSVIYGHEGGPHKKRFNI